MFDSQSLRQKSEPVLLAEAIRAIEFGVRPEKLIGMILVVDRRNLRLARMVFPDVDWEERLGQTSGKDGLTVVRLLPEKGWSLISSLVAIRVRQILDQGWLPVVVFDGGDQRVFGLELPKV